MTEPTLLKPSLYTDEVQPALNGGACACGYVFFPPQHYGCERCGRHGADLQPCLLAGRGRLVASAVVHIHAGERPAPFRVGIVALDDGPVVRTLLWNAPEDLAAGTRMRTTLVAADPAEDGTQRLDLRFTPEGDL